TEPSMHGHAVRAVRGRSDRAAPQPTSAPGTAARPGANLSMLCSGREVCREIRHHPGEEAESECVHTVCRPPRSRDPTVRHPWSWLRTSRTGCGTRTRTPLRTAHFECAASTIPPTRLTPRAGGLD